MRGQSFSAAGVLGSRVRSMSRLRGVRSCRAWGSVRRVLGLCIGACGGGVAGGMCRCWVCRG